MTAATRPVREGFRHEALLYAGADDFVARALPVIARAVNAGEPVLVAVDAAKIELLRDVLGGASRSVAWKDIRGVGGNPARIIPIWREFVARHRDRGRLWGFGEPIWAGRTPAELVEAQRHEALLNLAFADDPPFTLLCPYDTSALGPEVIREARRSHPFAAGQREWSDYVGLDAIEAPFDAPLPELHGQPAELVLDGLSAAGVRRFLTELADGIDPVRADDLTIAIAAVLGAMGRSGARVRAAAEPDGVVVEIGDLCPVPDPLAGREWPPPADGPSRGLWLANQLCDLVQLRSGPGRAVVRMHVGPLNRAGRG
jgi:hypothetical protein